MHPNGGFDPRPRGGEVQSCSEQQQQRVRSDHHALGVVVDHQRHAAVVAAATATPVTNEHRQAAGGDLRPSSALVDHRQDAAGDLQPSTAAPVDPHGGEGGGPATERDSNSLQDQARGGQPASSASPAAAGMKREVPVDDLLRAYLNEEQPDDTTKVGSMLAVQVVTKDPFIEKMLTSLQLDHLIDVFANNNIDRETVSFMSSEELKEVCPSVGHRIKIRNYLAKFDRPCSPLGGVSPERGSLSSASHAAFMAMSLPHLSHEVFSSSDLMQPPSKRPKRSAAFRFFKENKSLLELLSSSEIGRLLLQSYENKKSFDHRERAKLTHLIVDGLLDSPLVFKIPMLEEVADEVVRLFPTEVKQSYYIAPSPDRRAGAGKLVDRFKNQRRFFLKYRGKPRKSGGGEASAKSGDEGTKKSRGKKGKSWGHSASSSSDSEQHREATSSGAGAGSGSEDGGPHQASPSAPSSQETRASYSGDAFIQKMLGELGLDYLLDTFSCQNIDREVMSLMSEDDLKVLCPTYEHRTKICDYLARADASSPASSSPKEGEGASHTKQIGYRSSDRSFFNFELTLGEFLRASNVGRVLMESYVRRGTFENGERCKLTRVIVDGVYERHFAMRSELFSGLADEIVKEFPTEAKGHYYLAPTPLRKMCGGKLVQRYRNVKRLLRRYAGEDLDAPKPRKAAPPKRPPKTSLPPRVSSTRETRCRHNLDESDDWPYSLLLGGRGQSSSSSSSSSTHRRSTPSGTPTPAAPPAGGRDSYIDRMLTELHLEYLMPEFERQSIDKEVISTMSPEDLREICPIIGHRTKIRNYLARSAPAPPAADSTSTVDQAPEEPLPSPSAVDDALASFGSKSTVRSFFKDEQTLWEFLTGRGLGRALLQTYASKGEFSVQERQKLVHLLVDGLLERHTTVRASMLGELAEEVVLQFPTEVKAIYFVPSMKGKKVSSGKLVDRYRNVRKLLYALSKKGGDRHDSPPPAGEGGEEETAQPPQPPSQQHTAMAHQGGDPHNMSHHGSGGAHDLAHMMIASSTGPMGHARPHHLQHDGDMASSAGGHRGYDNPGLGPQVSSTSWAGGVVDSRDQSGYWGGGRPSLGYGGQAGGGGGGGGHFGSSLQLFPGGRTLGQHLASSEVGRTLVASYRRRSHFEPSERRKLVQVVVEGLLLGGGQEQHRVSTNALQQLAYEIVAEFPSEDRHTYFMGPLESGKRNACGKLVIRYRNRKKHFQRAAPPEQDYFSSPEVLLKIHQLQSTSGPWEEVERLWRETYGARAQDRQLGLPSSVFVAKWAPIKGERGPILVQWDFDVMFPGKRERLRPQWRSCANRLLRALQQRPNCGGLPTPADTSCTAELLSALSYLLQPSMIKNARGHWRPSMVEASEAFLLRTEEAAEVGRHQARLGAKCAHHGVPHQPQMFELQGPHPHFLVPIEEASWRFSDPLSCLDALFSTYHVLGLPYQPACRNTWVLVQRLFYDIATPDDRLAPCVSVLVNELSGAAATNSGAAFSGQ